MEKTEREREREMERIQRPAAVEESSRTERQVRCCWIAMIVSLVFCILLAIAFIIAFAIFYSRYVNVVHNQEATKTVEPCLSDDCVKTAARMIGARNLSVNPCDDFYEYACGSINHLSEIPAGLPGSNAFYEVDSRVKRMLTIELEKPVTISDPDPVKKLKTFYKSCLHCDGCSLDPLYALFDQDHGWPARRPLNWIEEGFSLEALLARHALLGNNALFTFDIGPDLKHPDKNVITFSQPSQLLGTKDQYTNTNFLDEYREIVKRLVWNLQYDEEYDKIAAAQQMIEVVSFEAQIAEIMLPKSEAIKVEDQYTATTLEELSKIVEEGIDFKKLVSDILAMTGYSMKDSDQIVVYHLPYFEKLGMVLKEEGHRPQLRVLVSYIMWHTLLLAKDSLPPEFIGKILPEDETLRWRRCIDLSNAVMPMALARVYVEQRHHGINGSFDQKPKVHDMLVGVRTVFAEMLDTDTWLDDKTRSAAKAKLMATKEKLLYPPIVQDVIALKVLYDGLVFNGSNFSVNFLAANRFMSLSQIKTLASKVDRNKWIMSPIAVNAMYSEIGVDITVPYALVQFPFYSDAVPMYVNYGALGSILGHEMTHGFDNRGRRYNKDGVLEPWWTPDAVQKFNKHVTCLIHQYDKYEVPVGDGKLMKVNGTSTLGENIADNCGLKDAYSAYKHWVSESKAEERRLPGIELNQDQLFFLSFAQVYCGSTIPEVERRLLLEDEHSPLRYRVIGTLSNSPDFARAFQCKLGSRMNPTDKCTVW